MNCIRLSGGTSGYGTEPTTSALQRSRLLSGVQLTSRDIAVTSGAWLGAHNPMYALHLV